MNIAYICGVKQNSRVTAGMRRYLQGSASFGVGCHIKHHRGRIPFIRKGNTILYMSDIQIFKNENFGEIRVVMNGANEPMFCASDVAKVLGYARPADAVSDHCKGVSILPTPTNGGVQQVKFIKEADVYRLVSELAKILKQNGVNMGQNRLYNWLREHGYLGRAKHTDNYNLPTQKAMDLGVFKVIKGKRIDKRTGGVIVTRTAKVTTKGLKYFIGKFLGRAAVL